MKSSAIRALNAPVVAPRIAAEQLVASGPGQHDLDELAGEPGDVVVRIALADAQVLEVPDELRKDVLHVAGVKHDLVVLGLQDVRHELGALALVEPELEAGRGAEVEPRR